MNSTDALANFETFRELPHAITLLGMSGVGKTLLSTGLRRSASWYHYSADYRIGTRYLAEYILDNVKAKIMRMRDPFVANLLRNDSIYINHNLSVDNLEPVSTFLGMFGDEALGGLDKATFLERQDLYRWAERESMKDVGTFIGKAWQIYGCKDFINDASGSLCEIVDADDADDAVLQTLRSHTLILYIRANAEDEDALKQRAESDPKPLFYYPDFIAGHLADQPDDGAGVDPKDFARSLFPALLEDRKPRYERLARDFGFSVAVDRLFEKPQGATPPNSEGLLRTVFDIISEQSRDSKVAMANAEHYVMACKQRQVSRDARR